MTIVVVMRCHDDSDLLFQSLKRRADEQTSSVVDEVDEAVSSDDYHADDESYGPY